MRYYGNTNIHKYSPLSRPTSKRIKQKNSLLTIKYPLIKYKYCTSISLRRHLYKFKMLILKCFRINN